MEAKKDNGILEEWKERDVTSYGLRVREVSSVKCRVLRSIEQGQRNKDKGNDEVLKSKEQGDKLNKQFLVGFHGRMTKGCLDDIR